MLLHRAPGVASSSKIQQRCQGAPQPRIVSSRRSQVCTAQNKKQGEAASPLQQRIALGAMAAASVASMALMPMEAQAVFGGGGIGTPHNYEDFSNRDLRKVIQFTKGQIRQANFTNCNLQGMSFFGAVAPGANFHGANMKLVNLDSADVENADFTDTILEEAYVANAQFQGVKIAGSDCEYSANWACTFLPCL
ncbi:hypothetical protein DUNSADRAFT_9683 [Dunaliella salina]|uniref:Uncharacterized protein n=1 Tax=Dunaliella salina TaxID=3046 RepID=A0ABQ7FSI2_DUNSA|nr:hypothetical protein DUNSADRAFT_9683 [Dunaliella salina]|eukprot:KAF5825464.1 hypothetical protein DUNSADRAFT_9683 [Dunaliella salina]